MENSILFFPFKPLPEMFENHENRINTPQKPYNPVKNCIIHTFKAETALNQEMKKSCKFFKIL